MTDRDEAVRLWGIVTDQVIEDGGDESNVRMRELGNHEFVVVLSTEVGEWFLWSHADWKVLRKQSKRDAVKQQKAKVKASRKKQKQEVSA